MPESVAILCPNCGSRLKIEPYQDEVQCKRCGQRSLVGAWQQQGGAPAPSPHAAHHPGVAASTAPARSRAWLWLTLSAVALAAAGGVVYATVILPQQAARDAPKAPRSMFTDARLIPKKLDQEFDFPIRVEQIMVYEHHADVDIARASDDGNTRVSRVTVRADRVLRRGAGQHTTTPFSIDDVDFALLPTLLAAASEVRENPDARPLRVGVGRDDSGALRWRVHLGDNENVQVVEFDIEGEPLAPKADTPSSGGDAPGSDGDAPGAE
ncbi:MAG: hypothetical protein Tsb0020_21560 [Haliangiales bacterium]